MVVTVQYVIGPIIGVIRVKNSNVQNAEKVFAVLIRLSAVGILVSANILYVVTVGINELVAIRFVQNAKISWVIQNPNICCTIVEYLAINKTNEN